VLDVPLDEMLTLSSANTGSQKLSEFSNTASVTENSGENGLLVVVTGDDSGTHWLDAAAAADDAGGMPIAVDVDGGDDDDELSDDSCVKTSAGGRREPLAEARPLTHVWPRGGGAAAAMVAAAECSAGLSVTVPDCCSCCGCCGCCGLCWPRTLSSMPLSCPFSRASVVVFSFRPYVSVPG
jgi:hypothetical protein